MVICLASLTYKNSAWRSKGARDSDWLLEWGKSYQERSGQSSPSVVVLSRLKPITDGDAKRWCKKLHETVKDSKTLEHVSNRVSEIYQDRPDLTLPMRDLIKEVKKTCSSY